MISEREYKKAQETINRASKTIEEYEKQQNTHIVDEYVGNHYNGYRTMPQAITKMHYWCSKLKVTVYCYKTTNERFVLLFEPLDKVKPEWVLSPIIEKH